MAHVDRLPSSWELMREERSPRAQFRMGLAVGVLLSCLAIGAIGLSANWFESHLTARQVMLRLQAAGLPCTKVTTPGAVLPVRAYDWGTCQIEGERIGIVT